jgi:hypothetical protein
MKVPTSSEQDGRKVRRFLTSPLTRESFLDFYNVCRCHTLAYLRYLQHKAVRMPVGSGVRTGSPNDLAIDILGTLFRNDEDRPFFVIFDHFDRLRLSDYDQADPCDLLFHLEGLLRGHVKQELSKLKMAYNSQIDNLKRRFKETLKTDEYRSLKIGGIEHVFLRQYEDNLRQDRPAIPYEHLVRIAESAYQESTDRKTWCRKILASIWEASEYRNLVKQHELLMAVVAVNSWYIDLDQSTSAKPTTPRQETIQSAVRSIIERTLTWTEKNIIQSFVDKGRISKDEASCLRLAVSRYLDDLGFHGETDPIPEYFRETMPETAHSIYLKKYKYVFETTIAKSLDHFRDNVKKESTRLGFGDYIRSG